jgi:hypothetical protein
MNSEALCNLAFENSPHSPLAAGSSPNAASFYFDRSGLRGWHEGQK